MDSDVFEMPWPQQGDDPLASGDDWWNNACLNFTHGPQWFAMARGFKMSADISVAHVMDGHRDQDFLVFPVLANYRHYIELALKGIICDCRALLTEPEKVDYTHGIDALWQTTKDLLSHIEPNGNKQDIKNVGDCLKRFHDLDPTSQEARYPVDRNNNPTLAGLSHVNLRQLRDVVERLSGFLDGVAMSVSVSLDHKGEMDAEFRAEMDAEFREHADDYR